MKDSLPKFGQSVIQARQVHEVGLESEVVRSKSGVSKFEHSQTNKRTCNDLLCLYATDSSKSGIMTQNSRSLVA